MSTPASMCARASRNSCEPRRCRPPMSSRPTSSSWIICPVAIAATLGAGARRDRGCTIWTARDAGHLAADRRNAGRCHRHDGVGRERLLPPAHAAAAAVDQRRGRRHRRAVLRALSAQRRDRRRRCRARPPRCSACWPRPRRRARAKSSWSPRRTRSSSRAACSRRKRSTMNASPSVFHVDRLELTFAPKPWAFAVERRAEIDAYFAKLQREKPAMWNGRVLLLHQSGGERRRVPRRLSGNRLCELRRLAPLGPAAGGGARLFRRGGDRRRRRRVPARRHGCAHRSMPARSIFRAARPIRTTSSTARSISISACGASSRRKPGSMRRNSPPSRAGPPSSMAR